MGYVSIRTLRLLLEFGNGWSRNARCLHSTQNLNHFKLFLQRKILVFLFKNKPSSFLETHQKYENDRAYSLRRSLRQEIPTGNREQLRELDEAVVAGTHN
jgi:hypothetical protein